LHLIGILFPHINDDARSKSHQIFSVCVQTDTEKRLHRGCVENLRCVPLFNFCMVPDDGVTTNGNHVPVYRLLNTQFFDGRILALYLCNDTTQRIAYKSNPAIISLHAEDPCLRSRHFSSYSTNTCILWNFSVHYPVHNSQPLVIVAR